MSSWDDGWVDDAVSAGLAELLRVAQSPPTADELAAEREIVADMQAAMSSSCDEEPTRADAEVLSGRRNRSTAVRLVAAKTAALVALAALGVAAAEATTGVVSAVFPDREPEVERQLTPQPTDPPKVPAPPGQMPETDTADDDARPSPAESDDAGGDDTESTATTEGPGGSGNPAATGSPGSSTNHPTAQTTTTTTPPPDDPPAPASGADQPQPPDSPGQSGAPPGQQDKPPRGRGHRDDP